MPIYRTAKIVHTTPESFLAWDRIETDLDEDDMIARVEVNPEHRDVASTMDPLMHRLAGVIEMMEDASDDQSSPVTLAVTMVWADTNDSVLLECPVCDSIKPAGVFILDPVDEDDPSGEMILICNDCTV